MTIFRDQAWNQIPATSEEDEAFNELQARLDRASEHAPSICPALSPAVQRPVPSRVSRPLPSTALASRSAATGQSFEGGLGARTPEAA